MTNTDYECYMRNIKSKDYLPKATIYFLEKMLEFPKPIIKKKLNYTYDTLKHKGGKYILERDELYPYANFSKAIERLNLLLSIDYPKSLAKDDFVKSINSVKNSVEQEKNFAKNMLQAFMHEDEAFYQGQAEISTGHSFMCYFLAYFSFLPFFVHMAAQVKQKYDEEVWGHGHCPYCGSAPLLSYLKGKEGKRVHACSLCLSFYRVPRIQCPYCLNSEQKKFSIFTSDTDADFQVCICKKCKNYIKIHDYKEYEKFTPDPLLDDFKTITLDIIAENQNYTKAVLSLWLI